MTVQVGRIAATGMASAPRPLRLCYAGDVALLRADQLDPARQRLQLGAELIGADSVAAASEVVSVAIDALRAAGVTNISIDFTLPDLVDTLAEDVAAARCGQARTRCGASSTPRMPAACAKRAGKPISRCCMRPGLFDTAIDKLAALDAGGALASRIAGLREIAATIGDRARVTLDPTERHGFEYQSWFGFTLYGEARRRARSRRDLYDQGQRRGRHRLLALHGPAARCAGAADADRRETPVPAAGP